MGPVALAVVAAASSLAVFLAVMAFRGLLEDVDPVRGGCRNCHRVPMVPMAASRKCWRCRHQRFTTVVPTLRHRSQH